MARRRGGRKGNPFERKVCDILSKWWCGNDEERIFWRTSGSGATATVRKRKGKSTHGHHNDVTNIHPSGRPLIDLVSIEIKKGYSKDTIHDLIDRPDSSKPKVIEEHFAKARRGMQESKSFAWMVIHERDSRKALVYFPHKLMTQFVNIGCFPKPVCPFVTIDTLFRYNDDNGKRQRVREIVVVMTLSKFLKRVKPDHIRQLAAYCN